MKKSLLQMPHIKLAVILLLQSVCLSAQDSLLILKSKTLTIELNKQGKITGIVFSKEKKHKPATAFTAIESFTSIKDNFILSADKKSIRFEHSLYSDSLKQSCTLIETFSSTSTGIRWDVEIMGAVSSWSAPVKTIVQYPADEDSRFWTTWGEPQFDSANCDSKFVASLSPYKKNSPSKKSWLDPLMPVPFSKQTLYYGAPPFEYNDIKAGFIPSQGNLFAIPLASVFEKKSNTALSIFLSPEDDIINLLMKTENNGSIQFERLFDRISNERRLKFSLDIVAHENDWRSALAWFANRYPAFVNPVNPQAAKLGGTTAYSNFFDDFDAAKMKRMAFTVNWQASFDFPYMGMFLPPVKPTESWTRLGGGSISINKMNDYALRMKQKGFYVMSYFNVTEFGSWFKYPCNTASDSNLLWKDCSAYLCTKFPNAMLKVADKVNITDALDSKTKHGGPYYSWKDAIATDCGDPAYQQFLLNQAKRHIAELPNSYGICIDRLDWLRFFNENADDGITWFDNKPARSLVNSWKTLMDKLGPMMHNAGKLIFVNNHYKRIDLLKQVDGILDEFTNAAAPLNTTAFLTLNKPALGWTPGKEVIEADGGDNFFQKYLYLGVFPMCPFPGNDHALQPDSMVDQLYLDYGPLMLQLKEKQWLLKPGIVSVKDDAARVNIFKTKNGYAIPVVYGEKDEVTVVLNDAAVSKPGLRFFAYHPGVNKPVELHYSRQGNKIELQVALIRGAAMVSISNRPNTNK